MVTEMETPTGTFSGVRRAEKIAQLIERDGTTCQYPGCGRELDFTLIDDPFEVTIDHWIPQWYGISQGWTEDKINDLSNLKLMERTCNAKKGDLIPNEDGTLPERPASKFKNRRMKRVNRPEICTACNAGRDLGPDEWCNACGHGANPGRYPKWRQMQPKDCDHDQFYCVSCTIWFPEQRRSALDALISGGPGYE